MNTLFTERGGRAMRRTLISLIAAAALSAAIAPAAGAAKGVRYVGKASGGHKVTFTLKNKRLVNFASGIPITCLSIQGGGAPQTAVQPVTVGWMNLPLKEPSGHDRRSRHAALPRRHAALDAEHLPPRPQ